MSDKKALFMSVANYEHLTGIINRYLLDHNLSAEDAGVRLDRLLYKAMEDVDSENPYISPFEKNKLTVQIVGAFLEDVATKRKPPPVKDEPLTDLEQRMQQMEAFRTDVDIGDPFKDFQQGINKSYEETGSAHAALRPDLAGLRASIGGEGGTGEDAVDALADPLLDKDTPKRIVKKYLMVNGYDRQWTLNPQRFSFSVNLSNADASFKDIREIAATRLIIPREIIEERTTTAIPKTQFEQPFGLQYPYVILKIADFQNVYKASNSASSNAFCHFIFDTFYTGPNGRGYIHLKPIQQESITFNVNPWASLNSMSLSILRPSGVLLNESRDDTKVLRFDWNNQVNANQTLIMVTLKNYFDRNEYFTGDTIRFRGFGAGATGLSIPASLVEFMNREEGHEIKEYGTLNSDGYVNTFYIRVPGEFNTDTGAFEPDTDTTGSLMTYIGSFDYTNDPPESVATVINASLQVAISFEIKIEEDDVSV